MDGLPCKQDVIEVRESDTELEDMKITLECEQVGRVVSLEIPPNPPEAVIMNLCEVQVYGFNYSGSNHSISIVRKYLHFLHQKFP